MNKIKFFTLAFWLTATAVFAQPKLQITDFATGFSKPLDIAHAGDSRLFIVEQNGKIWVLDSLGARLPGPFLDIDPRVNSTANERGLLGLAFHPNYKLNGFFYVYYTDNSGHTQVSRFLRDSTDANKADPNSELKMLFQTQPFNNHNGGCMKFGYDDYLYIGLGDGGSGGDPQGNGQKKNTFLGKILRIDVDKALPYSVPADNPFVSDPAYFPEIWATGLRNPWRFSFDKLTGDLWIGDVGQNAREEIDFAPAGVGGQNFGWRCYEGTPTYNTSGCLAASNYEKPVFEYANPSIGCSVTGGFVYRGSKYPEIFGLYIFADYCSGRIWQVKRNADGTFAGKQLENWADGEFSTFGEDRDGELYVAMHGSGKIMKISELCSNFKISGIIVNEICAGDLNGSINLNIENPSGGNVSISWSNGSTSASLSDLAAGNYIVSATHANGCVRRDTFQISNQSPTAPVFSGSFEICAGDSVQLFSPAAPAGFGYAWMLDNQLIAGQTGQNLVASMPGNYQVIFTGLQCNSAPSAAATVVVNSVPDPEILVVGDSLFTLENGQFFQWHLNDVPIPGATTASWVAQETGNYWLAVNNGKCVGISPTVFVEVSGTVLPPNVRHFRLSPNPTAGEIFVEIDFLRNEEVEIRVADAGDKTVLTQHFSGQKIRRSMDLKNLPSGAYFIHFQIDAGSFSRKILKK